jgi:hypothetical protein
VICEESFARHGHGCPFKARFVVVTTGWTMRLCGVHARPYARDLEVHARTANVLSVTPIVAKETA